MLFQEVELIKMNVSSLVLAHAQCLAACCLPTAVPQPVALAVASAHGNL